MNNSNVLNFSQFSFISTAFQGKAAKHQLDKVIVEDIEEFVKLCCGADRKTIRKAITSKCADEAKMARQNTKEASKTK